MMVNMDPYPSPSNLSPNNYSDAPVATKRFSMKSLIAIGALVLFAGIAVVSGLLLKQSSNLDDRSKAALSGVSYQAINEKFDANGSQAFEVNLVNNQQPDTVKYSSFTSEMTLYPVTKGQVLGTSTDSLIAATDPNVRFPIYSANPIYTLPPAPRFTPTPLPTNRPTVPSCNKSCVTNTQCGDGLICVGAVIQSPCPPGKYCAAIVPRAGSCRNVACSNDSTCGCVKTAPSPTPSTDTTFQLAQDGRLSVYVTSKVNDIFTFSAPTIARTTDGSGYKVTVTGKVKNIADKKAQALLRDKFHVFTVGYKGSRANEKFATAKLTWQSIKGFLAVAPNLEVELTTPQAPTPSPLSTPVATPISYGTGCMSDAQCGTGLTCVGYTKLSPCPSGAMCAAVMPKPGVCRNLACNKDCTSDAQCGTGLKCVGYVKPTPCPAGTMCAAVMPRPGSCRNPVCSSDAACGCPLVTPTPTVSPTPTPISSVKPSANPSSTPTAGISCGQPCGAQADGTVLPFNCAQGVCGNNANGGTTGNRCLPVPAPQGYVTAGGICATDKNPNVYCINHTDGTAVTTVADLQAACAAL